MSVKFTNFYVTTIANEDGLSEYATTLVVSDASGFPSLGSGDWCYLTLVNNTTGQYEIVKVTKISGNTLTIVRGEDGTTPLAFEQYDTVALRVCRAMLNDLMEAATDQAEAIALDAQAKAFSALSKSEQALTAIPIANAASTLATEAKQLADAAFPKTGGVVTGAVVFEQPVSFQGGASGVARQVGEIVMRLDSTAPAGTLKCDGSEYSAVSNPEYLALYDYLSSMSASYVVNSDTKSFKVPDLRGLVPVGAGLRTVSGESRQFVEGVVQGKYRHALTTNEMPSHQHQVKELLYVDGTTDFANTGTYHKCRWVRTLATESAGGNAPHENVQPVFPLNFFIVYQ